MKTSDRYNIGILIGGVHTIFPKNISAALPKLPEN